MRTRRLAVTTLALGAVGATAFGISTLLPTTAPPAAAVPGLTPFAGCSELLEHYRSNALEVVGPYGLEGEGYGMPMPGDGATGESAAADSATASSAGGLESAAAEPGSFSETNVQEEGVDEPDVVKTDGEVILTAGWDGAVRVVDAQERTLVSTLELPGEREGSSELLLQDGRLVVLSQVWEPFDDGSALVDESDAAYAPMPGAERTLITTVDLTDPADPQVIGSAEVSGGYRSARMVDGSVRLVTVSTPELGFTYPANGSRDAEEASEANNRRVIQDSTIEDWTPTIRTVDAAGTAGSSEPLLDCTAVSRPEEFSGFSTLAVLTLDVEAASPRPSSAAGLLADGATVYASTDRLVVSTTEWSDGGGAPWRALWPGSASSSSTALHTFDITDPARTDYVASGRVEGWLLSQFALDEQDGVLRVATTTDPSSEDSESSLITLREDGDTLAEVGRLDGLGVTEQIYAVRYLSADLAAVVTFRQVDPLYLIDTSDPADPTLLGELKIPGYSAYLHPIGEDLLLGIGQDADPETGQTNGSQASLFDISDPTAPERVDQVTWENGYSPVEWDHRAFTWWGPDSTAFLPMESWSETGEGDFIGVVGVEVDAETGELRESGRAVSGDVEDYTGAAQRTIVIGDTLWALTETDLVPFDRQTLESDGDPVDLGLEY